MNRLYTSRAAPWLVWGLAALFGLFAFMIQGAPSVMIPQLMKTYNIHAIKIAILTSSFFYTYILMQIPAGMIVDLWGPRRILKFGYLFCSMSIAWFAMSNYFWEAQVSRMLMGFFASPTIICAFCLGSRWFKPSMFILIVALTEFIALSGGVIGEAGLSKMVSILGWRTATISLACTGLALMFLSLFIIHDYPSHDQPLHSSIRFSDACKSTFKNTLEVIKIKALWINGICGGLIFGIFPSFAALWSIPYFSKRYAISTDLAATLASTIFLGACIGALLLGILSTYSHKRRPLIILSSLVSCAIISTILYIPNISLSIMYILTFSLGLFSSIYTLAFSMANTYTNQKTKGATMGLTNMLCLSLGAPLYQPLIGFLLTHFHNGAPVTKAIEYSHSSFTIALSILPLSYLLACIVGLLIKTPNNHTTITDASQITASHD